MRICIVQPNLRIGDIQGNAEKILECYHYANAMSCDLVIAPELSISGYNIRDLALNKEFIRQNQLKVYQLARATKGLGQALLLGHVWPSDQGEGLSYHTKPSFNAASFIDNGWIIHQHVKQHLANYDIFDEERVFTREQPIVIASGDDNVIGSPRILHWRNLKIGIMICEDMWYPELADFYAREMYSSVNQTTSATSSVNAGSAETNLFIVINGSPYSINKATKRYDVAQAIVKKHGIPLIYVNQFGGQDNIIFDGGSFILNHDASYQLQPIQWVAGCIIIDIAFDTEMTKRMGQCSIRREMQPNSNEREEKIHYEKLLEGFDNDQPETAYIYQAVLQATKDYIQKSSFEKIVLGLSGGIDSALVATIACDALGPGHVRCIALPSEYSSDESLIDAKDLCKKLGCHLNVIPIHATKEVMERSLSNLLGTLEIETTAENLQARIRGVLLMAISNKEDSLLLCCSNKSESAVGYATLYGDVCGAFAPIADIYKSQVYELAKWRNENLPYCIAPVRQPIPRSIIEKEPSAELRPNQKDRDTLLPYEVLDPILYCLIEQNVDLFTAAETTKQSLLEVKKIYNLLSKHEFKRQQFPCFPKISKKALTYDRRYPITNFFKG